MGTDISSLDPISILLIIANLVLILIAVFVLIRLRRKQKMDESEKEKRPEPGIAEIKPEVPVLESVPAVLAQKGESIKPETEPFSWVTEPLPEKAEFEQKIPETQTDYPGSMLAQSYDESERKDESFSTGIEDTKPDDSESLVEDENEPVPGDEIPEADVVVLQQIKELLEKEASEPFSMVGEGGSESTVVEVDDELKLEDEVPEEAFANPQKKTLALEKEESFSVPTGGIKPEENELELEDEVPEIADAVDLESIKETQVHEDQEKIEEKTEKKKRET